MRKAPSQGAPFATRLDSDKSSRVMSLGGSCLRRPLLGFGQRTHPVSAANIPGGARSSSWMAAKLQSVADDAPDDVRQRGGDIRGTAIVGFVAEHLVAGAFARPSDDLRDVQHRGLV